MEIEFLKITKDLTKPLYKIKEGEKPEYDFPGLHRIQREFQELKNEQE